MVRFLLQCKCTIKVFYLKINFKQDKKNKYMVQSINDQIKISFKVFSFVFLIFTIFNGVAYGQMPKKPTSGEIYHQLEKLGFLGSVLYIAAHPDDENTRMISFLANGKKAHTTYLSLTRGDGGQNLIGSEVNELLGVMRTQELLMARSIDNGKQMFSRANDFGYSKNAEETIKIWDTDKVKADVVWAIRKTRPDVIINRFDHRTSGSTHGHHTASGLLSFELFDQASKDNIYPEQLHHVSPWQPRRLFFNTSWWFYGSEEKFKQADKSKLMSMDVGVYFPMLGKSNTEIAAESRSRHKCQGFGATGTRGMQLEYLELLKGDLPPSKSDIFEGINTTWSRVGNGADVQKLVQEAIEKFDFKEPSKSVQILVKIYNAIQKTDDVFWKKNKSQEAIDLIAACLGLFLEAKSSSHKIIAGESFPIDIEVIHRLGHSPILLDVKGIGIDLDTVFNHALTSNEPLKWNKKIILPEKTPLSPPYWLTQQGSLGMYHVEDQSLIGEPQTPRSIKVQFNLNIEGQTFSFERDVIYKYNSPEYGETYRPLEVVPPITVKIQEPVYIFANSETKDVKVTVQSWAKNQSGRLFLEVPTGWKLDNEYIDFNIAQKGESKDFVFKVSPSMNHEEVMVSPKVIVNENMYNSELVDINYDHIPFQTVLRKSISKFAKIDIKTNVNRVLYIMGAGDEIPNSLKQIGCTVDVIQAEDVSLEKLNTYHTLILGVRAYNTQEQLKFKTNILFDFVHKGGTVVVQYNTAHELVTKEIAPYPLTISRDRVTVEDAEMRLVAPHHDVVNTPNKITEADFRNWVQERGLYFASEWSPQFTPIFSCNDPGEKPTEGSLLVAKHGEGYFVYTGISFFRQLPSGVSGAFRLFANLISLGSDVQP